VEVEVSLLAPQMEIMAPPGMEDLTSQLQGHVPAAGGGRRKLKKMPVAEALRTLTDEEAAKLVNDDEMKAKALASVEQNGIVFLGRDRQDREPAGDPRRRRLRARRAARSSCRWSRERRSRRSTGWCAPITSCSSHRGRFHFSKPSDLIPELQGTLSDPRRALLAVGRRLRADPDGDRRVPRAASTSRCSRPRTSISISCRKASGRLAEIAFAVNERQENIGARRLHTVMERPARRHLVPGDTPHGETITIDAAYVDAKAQGHRRRRESCPIHPVANPEQAPHACAARFDGSLNGRARPRHHPAGLLDHRLSGWLYGWRARAGHGVGQPDQHETCSRRRSSSRRSRARTSTSTRTAR
jgi:ATP-dependent HslUV protease ATP-binding subunit HslU